MIQSETLELLEWPRLCEHLATFAATKLGAIAARNLPMPATREETIQLLAQTEEVYQLETGLVQGWSFDGIEDIGGSLERAELQGILSGQQLLNIATTTAGVRRLRRVIDNYGTEKPIPVLTELVAELRTYPELEQEINHCIDDRGDVANRASPKLGGIRDSMGQIKNRIENILRGILQRKAGAVQQQLITQRSDRFVIPVRAPQRDAIPGIVHDTSTTGSTLFIEPHAVVNLNNQMRQLRRQEEREEEAIRQALTEKVAEVKEDLEKLLAIATALDLATARARYSIWLDAWPPKFIPVEQASCLFKESNSPGFVEQASCLLKETNGLSGETADSQQKKKVPRKITLRQLRHPLLVWQQQHEDGPQVVPIDLIIEPQIRVVAITGPNTGGKTVTLKTLGLAALMAKVGLFVAAKEPVELPWFEQVLADIGDEQSIEQSLSTFSGHIRRITRVIEAVENSKEAESLSPSLVLLDEIGAGTDPTEGSALATSLLKHLADRALLTVATTHFGELKALKYQDDRFENASVEFDNVSLGPTYRLLWGIPGRSNALTIAGRLGLSEAVINDAREYVGIASHQVEEVIEGLEAQRRRQETKATEASKLLQETERLHGEVSQKARSLKQRERELKQAQELAVQEAIAEAKAEIAEVIRGLQRAPQTGRNAQKATDALNQVTEKFLPSKSKEETAKKPDFMPTEGDRVRIPRIGQTAEVLTVDENEQLTVRFGVMKMTLDLSEIESLDGQKPTSKKSKNPSTALEGKKKPAEVQNPSPPPVAVRTSRNTIDIRGSHVADAEIKIDGGISKAIEQGVLWIVHGKGTGKLRQGTHEFLKRHPLVERYELASQKEGGSGVTIAYLK
ncbi:MAG: endonuclease MutS2 [Cyanobacteriota bacterium]|nr:endonuclease MutS2 [Cyanobacteriota bacterium]